jgi:ribonucleotide monophosphatase NagD (HAD superfamily)
MNRIIAFQPSLVSLVEKYQALLVDAYGVLVDKVVALPGVSDLIAYLNTSVKRYEQPGKIYS